VGADAAAAARLSSIADSPKLALTSRASTQRMGKLKSLSGREVCAILAHHGFIQRGSHIVMQRSEDRTTTTVPVPNHRELARGTLAAIIRQSGLPRAAFET
jgi:predicted RNA binding protein YcfA (HicA-like mRNA interferase family)